MTTTNSSSHLKEVMAEIKAVLAKHDVAAYVLLHEPGFAEYLISIEPTWSIISLKDKQVSVHSNLQKDFGGDLDAQKYATISTANMVYQFLQILARDADNFKAIYKILSDRWNIFNTELIHTEHKTH